MNQTEIIKTLPYQKPFLFVDELTEISEHGVTGNYTFKKNEFFYKGHFKNNPITPGVILTEAMAQIGVVCLGVYLLRNEFRLDKKMQIALTSSQVDFFISVFPNEKVTVIPCSEISVSSSINKNEFFYKGHFKNNPITPGVILTEAMAQIGVVCLGIYLLKNEFRLEKKIQIALTSSQVDFFISVLPNEKVTVISEKKYFRFNK